MTLPEGLGEGECRLKKVKHRKMNPLRHNEPKVRVFNDTKAFL